MLRRLIENMDPRTQRMLIRTGWLALLLAVVVIYISAVAHRSESLAEEVWVGIEPLPDGNSLLSEKDVREAIERSFGYKLEGRTLVSIDVNRLERILEEEPFILDAQVYIGANNKVAVKIIPRAPILRVIDNNGYNYYLDSDGVQMPLSKHFTAKVLVVTGSLPVYEEKFMSRKRNRLKEAFQLAQLILQDEFLSPLTEQIYFDNKGHITLVPKIGGHTIAFGPFGNEREKLRRLKIFYKEVLPYEGWQRYKEINLAYDGQVVAKK